MLEISRIISILFSHLWQSILLYDAGLGFRLLFFSLRLNILSPTFLSTLNPFYLTSIFLLFLTDEVKFCSEKYLFSGYFSQITVQRDESDGHFLTTRKEFPAPAYVRGCLEKSVKRTEGRLPSQPPQISQLTFLRAAVLMRGYGL